MRLLLSFISVILFIASSAQESQTIFKTDSIYWIGEIMADVNFVRNKPNYHAEEKGAYNPGFREDDLENAIAVHNAKMKNDSVYRAEQLSEMEEEMNDPDPSIRICYAIREGKYHSFYDSKFAQPMPMEEVQKRIGVIQNSAWTSSPIEQCGSRALRILQEITVNKNTLEVKVKIKGIALLNTVFKSDEKTGKLNIISKEILWVKM